MEPIIAFSTADAHTNMAFLFGSEGACGEGTPVPTHDKMQNSRRRIRQAALFCTFPSCPSTILRQGQPVDIPTKIVTDECTEPTPFSCFCVLMRACEGGRECKGEGRNIAREGVPWRL
jgi:hypothetical protein